jgi:hypothetical protein
MPAKTSILSEVGYFVVHNFWFFGYFYGKPGSKSLKALLCRHFIENMEIIVYNPCPVRVFLSSILNHHKRDARAVNLSDTRLLRKVGYLVVHIFLSKY